MPPDQQIPINKILILRYQIESFAIHQDFNSIIAKCEACSPHYARFIINWLHVLCGSFRRNPEFESYFLIVRLIQVERTDLQHFPLKTKIFVGLSYSASRIFFSLFGTVSTLFDFDAYLLSIIAGYVLNLMINVMAPFVNS